MSVALVIPNRNNSRFLPQCLNSVGRQTRPFDEVIVVDDASTDDSLAVLSRFAGKIPSLRVIAQPRRTGVSVARDVGIRSASARFITTLDSDDYLWSDAKNEAELSVVERSEDPESTVAFSDIRRVGITGEDLGVVSRKRRIREGQVFWKFLFLSGMIPRDFMFPRSAYLKAGGYDPELEIYEDWDLKIRLARICSFQFSGVCGVAYRENPLGLSKASLGVHYDALSTVLRKNTLGMSGCTRFAARGYGTLRILWFLRRKLIGFRKETRPMGA